VIKSQTYSFGFQHRDPLTMAATLKTAIAGHLWNLQKLTEEQLLAARYEKFRSMGRWFDPVDDPGVIPSR
jgi:acetyl-CoA carboxylase alpha subunit